MPRRRVPNKRKILPDPKFLDRVVTKFVNDLMRKGKKSIAERVTYGAFALIEERAKEEPLKTFKKALDTMKIPDELQREMTTALRRLRKTREHIERDYKFVRNATIAHRDPDVLAQYRAIRDLDTDKLYGITAEFFQAVDQFVIAHTKVLTTSATMASVLAQWAEHEKGGAATPP